MGHALYKATLFMTAGSIDHETGTRDTRILGSLRGVMPLTCVAGLLAAISKMGLPPLLGFIGKEYTYKGYACCGFSVDRNDYSDTWKCHASSTCCEGGYSSVLEKRHLENLPKKPRKLQSVWCLG